MKKVKNWYNPTDEEREALLEERRQEDRQREHQAQQMKRFKQGLELAGSVAVGIAGVFGIGFLTGRITGPQVNVHYNVWVD